jgi:hypothetical protein
MTAGLLPLLLGCDSTSYPHPDTGYGAAEPVPPTKSCADFCARSADCVVDLCDENTSSTRYAAIHDPLDAECLAGCTDAQLQAMATDASWQCFFTASCRQVFDNDVCKASVRYSCP